MDHFNEWFYMLLFLTAQLYRLQTEPLESEIFQTIILPLPINSLWFSLKFGSKNIFLTSLVRSAIASSLRSDWFIGLSAYVVIGQSNQLILVFVLGLLNWKPLFSLGTRICRILSYHHLSSLEVFFCFSFLFRFNLL